MGVVSNGTKRRSIGPIAGARDKGQSSWGEKRGGGSGPAREREGKGSAQENSIYSDLN
jgi:hypothetical protein